MCRGHPQSQNTSKTQNNRKSAPGPALQSDSNQSKSGQLHRKVRGYDRIHYDMANVAVDDLDRVLSLATLAMYLHRTKGAIHYHVKQTNKQTTKNHKNQQKTEKQKKRKKTTSNPSAVGHQSLKTGKEKKKKHVDCRHGLVELREKIRLLSR